VIAKYFGCSGRGPPCVSHAQRGRLEVAYVIKKTRKARRKKQVLKQQAYVLYDIVVPVFSVAACKIKCIIIQNREDPSGLGGCTRTDLYTQWGRWRRLRRQNWQCISSTPPKKAVSDVGLLALIRVYISDVVGLRVNKNSLFRW